MPSPLAGLEGVQDWVLIGISALGDVMDGLMLKSYQSLQEEFQLHKHQFYRYLQLRHAISPLLPGLGDLTENNPLKGRLLSGKLGNTCYHMYIWD